jgi:hypothetical protein
MLHPSVVFRAVDSKIESQIPLSSRARTPWRKCQVSLEGEFPASGFSSPPSDSLRRHTVQSWKGMRLKVSCSLLCLFQQVRVYLTKSSIWCWWSMHKRLHRISPLKLSASVWCPIFSHLDFSNLVTPERPDQRVGSPLRRIILREFIEGWPPILGGSLVL